MDNQCCLAERDEIFAAPFYTHPGWIEPNEPDVIPLVTAQWGNWGGRNRLRSTNGHKKKKGGGEIMGSW